jgi:outer membrane murein-binding lipoprotein Lpp
VRARAPRVPFVILVGAVLLAGTVGLLLFNTSMQQAAFTGAELQSRVDLLDAKEQTLARQAEELRDPQRLAEQATAMGMVPASSPAVIDLREGRITVPGVPASPEDALDVAPPEPVKPAVLDPAPIYRDVTPPAAPAQGTTQGTPGEQAPADGQQDLPTDDAPAQQ